MTKRCIVYIDGFNLYYGALKDSSDRWLDLQKYFERLRNGDEVVAVKYFTALVDHHPSQKQYLLALGTLPKVKIYLGAFTPKKLRCGVQECTYTGVRFFNSKEEKKTDVNLGVSIVSDAYEDEYDVAVVVSGDTDLNPAIYMVIDRFPEKKIVVYVPDRSGRRGLPSETHKLLKDQCKPLPTPLLSKSQLPDSVIGSCGNRIEKPVGW